jgi:CubicO group peptidase (beta-lactamase class C family)
MTAAMRTLATLFRLATAYKARVLCNGVFVSGLAPRRLSREDAGYKFFFHLAWARVDRERRRVTCSILGTGLFRETAIYVDGIGAVLLVGVSEEAVRAWPRVPLSTPRAADFAAVPWPIGDAIAPAARVRRPNSKKVGAAVDRQFDDRGRRNPLRTRAMLVVHDGRIICERHAPGFGPGTRMLSWSMAKSVTSVLVGILAGQGKVDVDGPAPVPEWANPRDPRHAITPSQLLRMSSGLAWTETYGEQPISDVNRMLFLEPDMARFAASRPLAEEPGTTFLYSSGSTNILCRSMRSLFASAGEYLAFPHRALFDRIGMHGAVWGTDASGTIVGSSYLFATARDYARFGMFCLADGVWQGERILPEGWLTWATTPTPTDPTSEYGAGFYLNRDPADASKARVYPRLPTDFYYANGHQGQMIGVIPSRKLVVVRLGMTWGSDWGREDFLAELLEA